MNNRNSLSCIFLIILAVIAAGCSTTRHLEGDSLLLDDVKIRLNDSTGLLDETELMTYVRNQENNRMLWSAKVRLGVYNMSGKDTTKWWNRFIRKLGEPPVVFDYNNSLQDADQLKKAMVNAGFLKANVEIDTISNRKKRKMKVVYDLNPGKPYIIRSVEYQFPNDTLRDLVMRDSNRMLVRAGDVLDRSVLESERDLITTRLKNRGYYAFGKEFITFNADTTEGSREVDLTLTLNPPYPFDKKTLLMDTHREYIVRNVIFITDYAPGVTEDLSTYSATDTVHFKDITILYGREKYLRPNVLAENCFINPGELYRLRDVNKTYSALARLQILKFINIRFLPVGSDRGPVGFLDAYVLLTRGKSQSVAFEIEGTNSEGDLGVAAGINYSHKNIAKGSETLSTKIRGAYESLSGNLSGFIHNRYMEYSIEAGINFPKFKAPFLKESFKRRIMASTEFNVSMNYQERPEYTRIISTAGWSYKWTEHNNRDRHTFTPIDINYVYLPESTNDFINQIAPDNPLLRYSYEDHFIMRLGYNFYHTNKRRDRPWRIAQRNIFTLRVNGEVAGNLLFALNSIFNHRPNFHSDPYKVFGIRYSQYAKAEADLAFLHIFNERNALAWHAGFGIGVPYGNSTVLPFEKRFYGGGANGVRGWDVRTLGPGRYPGTNSVSDFINQCGDIRLELSAEYRAKLFWVVEGAAFIDVGNIWTIRNYATQPYGTFYFNSFYKELAAAYGLGVRLDFSYFLLRFDLGMKAHNPAINAEPWPLIHPKWHRDSSFHFSIGYPF
ncbi:MAG: BamA/TamA family outer membrane protein [Muribaculaceae bacterium]|nr:BamA/TamA family outer membrane protein [Muribaculaceae bacterium]